MEKEIRSMRVHCNFGGYLFTLDRSRIIEKKGDGRDEKPNWFKKILNEISPYFSLKKERHSFGV